MSNPLARLVDLFLRPVYWREQLQDDITTNISMRSQSMRRVGDSLTETKAHLEGAYKAREVTR